MTEEYKKDVRGRYFRLTVTVEITFMRKLLKFNVWKDLKRLCRASYELGDQVKVEYHYKGSFPELISLEMAYFINCLNCYASILPKFDKRKYVTFLKIWSFIYR